MQSTSRKNFHRPQNALATKLRTSCDSCAAAKVKCNQQKPSCRRCIGLNLECIYGPSRRKGKPGPATIKNNSLHWSTQAPQSTRRSSASISSLSPSEHIQPFGWWASNAMQSLSGLHPVNQHAEPLASGSVDSILWQDSPCSPGRPGVDPTTLYLESSNPIQTTFSPSTGEPGLFGKSNVIHTLTEKSMTEMSDVGTMGVEPVAHDACLGKAFEILRRLYHLGLQCRPSELSPGKPTFDQVLGINKISIQSLEDLLHCNYPVCRYDFHLHHLFATICSKILGWYRAVYWRNIVQAEQQSHQDEQLPTPISDVADIPLTLITVGDFKLDVLAERRMKAQLLLYELQKMKKVLDGLSKQIGGDTGMATSEQMVVHDTFDQYLRNDLNDMVGQLNEFCMLKY